MPAKQASQGRRAAAAADNVWTDEERAAIQESARERRRRPARNKPEEERAQGEADIQAKIAEMPDQDRAMAKRIHELVLTTAPDLMPRTYYGMPAYARDGKNICFFQPSSKFKLRYSTFGFEQAANLDDGSMWPVAYALTELTPANEARIVTLVKKAVG